MTEAATPATNGTSNNKNPKLILYSPLRTVASNPNTTLSAAHANHRYLDERIVIHTKATKIPQSSGKISESMCTIMTSLTDLRPDAVPADIPKRLSYRV
jgi:hypothetical protein